MPNYLADPLPLPDDFELDCRRDLACDGLVFLGHLKVKEMLEDVERCEASGAIDRHDGTRIIESVYEAWHERVKWLGLLGVTDAPD